MIIDIGMTILLLFLMARQLIGDTAHEWIGAGMFLLWIAVARSLHVFCGYWCFVLMSLHLGLHWNMILGKMKKAVGKELSGKWLAALRLGATAIAGYGLYAFCKNYFYRYMFLISSFVFFDFERPVALYVTEYLAVMGLFAYLAYYGGKKLQKLAGRSRKGTKER